MPLISPPMLSTVSALPARAKPIAAPGITACERTSPTRPIRLSKSNVPSGPLATASAMQATSADRMKAYSAKGVTRADQTLMSTARPQDGIVSRNREPAPWAV